LKTPLRILVLFLTTATALAHEGHHHPVQDSATKIKEASPDTNAKYAQINAAYTATVKAIFQNKCFDCHSTHTKFPPYYSWPIAHQLIDHDTQEAKEHLGMDNDFPFAGHGNPLEDLEAIGKETRDGGMPPWRYTILHSEARLTAAESEVIMKWVNDSVALLKVGGS